MLSRTSSSSRMSCESPSTGTGRGPSSSRCSFPGKCSGFSCTRTSTRKGRLFAGLWGKPGSIRGRPLVGLQLGSGSCCTKGCDVRMLEQFVRLGPSLSSVSLLSACGDCCKGTNGRTVAVRAEIEATRGASKGLQLTHRLPLLLGLIGGGSSSVLVLAEQSKFSPAQAKGEGLSREASHWQSR